MSWDEKMRRKTEQKKMVEINRKMKETKAKRIRGEAERLKEKAKRKEINTYKSASFQIVIFFLINFENLGFFSIFFFFF